MFVLKYHNSREIHLKHVLNFNFVEKLLLFYTESALNYVSVLVYMEYYDSYFSELEITIAWFYGHWNLILWSLKLDSMVTETWFYGHWNLILWSLKLDSMVTETWFYGH